MNAETLAAKIHETLAANLPKVPADTIRVDVHSYGTHCNVRIRFDLTGVEVFFVDMNTALLSDECDIRQHFGGNSIEVVKDGDLSYTKIFEEFAGYRVLEYRQKIEEMLRMATRPLPVPIREEIIPNIAVD